MTPSQRQELQRTFEQLTPLPADFGATFYRRLFALDPSLRALFRDDLENQGRMFANALTLALMNLSSDGRLSRVVSELGGRHAGYGVRREHYESFGKALFDTVGERLGERFTPKAREAWLEAYGQLSEAMLAVPGHEAPS